MAKILNFRQKRGETENGCNMRCTITKSREKVKKITKRNPCRSDRVVFRVVDGYYQDMPIESEDIKVVGNRRANRMLLETKGRTLKGTQTILCRVCHVRPKDKR